MKTAFFFYGLNFLLWAVNIFAVMIHSEKWLTYSAIVMDSLAMVICLIVIGRMILQPEKYRF